MSSDSYSDPDSDSDQDTYLYRIAEKYRYLSGGVPVVKKNKE